MCTQCSHNDDFQVATAIFARFTLVISSKLSLLLTIGENTLRTSIYAEPVALGGAQLGHYRHGSAEDIQRTETVVIIVAMEETSFLLAVNLVVGGIQIKNDTLGPLGQALDEVLDEEVFDPSGLRRDFLVFDIQRLGREFHAVQSALARQGLSLVLGRVPVLPFDVVATAAGRQ